MVRLALPTGRGGHNGRVSSPAGHLRSVHVGTPEPCAFSSLGRTSIRRSPTAGAVTARRLGLVGDEVADHRHHGGVDQAVYAYDRAELDWWAAELDAEIADGLFGENLTLVGVAVDDAEVGERWRIGSALFEVASVRIPCKTFAGRLAEVGLDARGWVKRYTAHGRSGAYLRVVEEGALRSGDAVTVEHRPGHGVTVAEMFRAVTTERDLLPRLLVIDDLVAEARVAAEKYIAR